MFTGHSLLLGVAVALLCDVLAYTLQADALPCIVAVVTASAVATRAHSTREARQSV